VTVHALQVLLPALLIFLTASLSFLFARLNSRDTRKYEVRKIAVLEALGPIYGEVLRVQDDLDKAQAELRVSYHSQWEEQWNGIRYSYRFFVIPEPLRSTIQAYFDRLNKFTREQYRALEDIMSIEKQAWSKVVPVKEVNTSAQFRLRKGDEMIGSNLQTALYYGVSPNSLSNDPYDYLNVSAILPDGRNGQWTTNDSGAMRDSMEKVWNLTYPQVAKSARIVGSLKEYHHIKTETTRLRANA